MWLRCGCCFDAGSTGGGGADGDLGRFVDVAGQDQMQIYENRLILGSFAGKLTVFKSNNSSVQGPTKLLAKITAIVRLA